ncbi:GntR family transcriptional regulator [Propionibacteriaceae bacterium Y2011]|uniref:GntR family transcriptional regulator n=1 Tax=Microlunatus sp. Y2014 TaxID=3418488 RepID=UPI003B4D00AD
MTTKRQADEAKQSLVVELSAAIARGELRPGDPITSVGVLARRYGVSRPTVRKALRPLFDDGVLVSVPSVGVFVGHTESTRSGCYVALVDPSHVGRFVATSPTIHSFEERISTHGGRSLVLGNDAFLDEDLRSSIPGSVLGVFVFTGGRVGEVADAVAESVPVVSYLAGSAPPRELRGSRVTHVEIDNVTGGTLATTELLRDGHRDVAFLGIHADDGPDDPFPWSAQRAAGWRQALRRHLPRVTPRCFQPSERIHDHHAASEHIAATAADAVLEQSACVGADDLVLLSLVRAWQRAGVPQSQWPTLVGFEGLAEAEQLLASSVRPRWDELGVKAADHLFDGSRGRPRRAGSIDHAGMILISRPLVTHGGSSARSGNV